MKSRLIGWLAFHVGDEVVHFDELWGHAVSVDFHFFRTDDVAESLRSAGFEVEEIVERDPYVTSKLRLAEVISWRASERLSSEPCF
jgi:hypothetical protein